MKKLLWSLLFVMLLLGLSACTKTEEPPVDVDDPGQEEELAPLITEPTEETAVVEEVPEGFVRLDDFQAKYADYFTYGVRDGKILLMSGDTVFLEHAVDDSEFVVSYNGEFWADEEFFLKALDDLAQIRIEEMEAEERARLEGQQ